MSGSRPMGETYNCRVAPLLGRSRARALARVPLAVLSLTACGSSAPPAPVAAHPAPPASSIEPPTPGGTLRHAPDTVLRYRLEKLDNQDHAEGQDLPFETEFFLFVDHVGHLQARFLPLRVPFELADPTSAVGLIFPVAPVSASDAFGHPVELRPNRRILSPIHTFDEKHDIAAPITASFREKPEPGGNPEKVHVTAEYVRADDRQRSSWTLEGTFDRSRGRFEKLRWTLAPVWGVSGNDASQSFVASLVDEGGSARAAFTALLESVRDEASAMATTSAVKARVTKAIAKPAWAEADLDIDFFVVKNRKIYDAMVWGDGTLASPPARAADLLALTGTCEQVKELDPRTISFFGSEAFYHSVGLWNVMPCPHERLRPMVNALRKHENKQALLLAQRRLMEGISNPAVELKRKPPSSWFYGLLPDLVHLTEAIPPSARIRAFPAMVDLMAVHSDPRPAAWALANIAFADFGTDAAQYRAFYTQYKDRPYEQWAIDGLSRPHHIDLKFAAMEVLGRIAKTEEAKKALSGFLTGGDWSLRLAAARALSMLGDDRAVGVLLAGLAPQMPGTYTRIALDGLRYIAPSPFGYPYSPWQAVEKARAVERFRAWAEGRLGH